MNSELPKKTETPMQQLCRRQEEQSAENMLKGAVYNLFLSEDAGSDPKVIAKIQEAIEKRLPFGLKCQRSSVVFIPHKLKAYWIWGDGDHGPVFNYENHQDFLNSVKFQYLGHKEWISTKELVALSKVIILEGAIETVNEWEQAKKRPE